jgi:hypothetical protein
VQATSDVGNWPAIAFAQDGTAWITWGNDSSSDIEFARLNRGGELLTTPGLSGTSNGATISESHGDMTSTTDTANRDDADCVSGTWVNGKWFEADRANGVSLASGQCTEISFSIDTSQATAGTTYRLMLATADSFNASKDMWRGATVASSAYATLTIDASTTTTRYSKDRLPTSATDCTSSAWACSAVDVTSEVGTSTVAVAPDGTPWIAYNDAPGATGALKVAKYVGEGNGGSTCPGGSNAWSCSTVEQNS